MRIRCVMVGAALATLAACGGPNDRTALTQACVDGGENLEACTCIADAMERNLGPTLYKRTVQAVAREKRDVPTYIASLPEQQQLEFADVLDDMFSCRLSPPIEAAETP